MAEIEEYDVIVIGAGPAGENAADYAVRGSERTAVLIERELVGGECSYYACMPSKALLRPLDVAAAAAQLGGLRPPEIDRNALLARRDSWVSGYSDAGQARWAEGAGIDLVRGTGRLSGERSVEVIAADGSVRSLRAAQAVVLATGSVAMLPNQYAGIAAWSSRDATAVVEIPDSLTIIGGGVVACETARWMQALGSRVTLVVRDGRLLSRAEEWVSAYVVAGLQAAGVEVRLGVEVSAVSRAAARDTGLGRVHGGPVTLDVDGERLVSDEILVAVGRQPATEGLGLESLGLSPDSVAGVTQGGDLPDWLYTVGDVNGVAPLTHWGKYQARRVGRTIADRAEGRAALDPSAPPADAPVPQVVFTDPQVAWVGMTTHEAEAAGISAGVVDADYATAAGAALLRDDVSGRARLVVAEESGRLLGATFVGADVAELLHSATVAITGRLDIETLAHAVPSYPTASEIWLRLVDQWASAT